MKKRGMKIGVVALATLLVSAFGMVGCKPKTGGGVFTYNEYISASPTSWNSHIGTSDADSYVQQYTEMGLYDITLSEDKSTYAFVDEMAKGDPVDVTSDYVGQYGIGDKDTGKAWKINLNPDATWANGNKITSEDYLYSMGQLLNPQMKNTKASRFYTGTSELYNGFNYYMTGDVTAFNKIHNSEKLSDAEIDALIDAGQLYFSLNNGIGDAHPVYGAARTITEQHIFALERQAGGNSALIKGFHEDKDLSKPDLYDTVLSKFQFDALGYVQVTKDNLAVFKEKVGMVAKQAAACEWYNLCAIGKPTVTVYNNITDDDTYTDEEITNIANAGNLYISVNTAVNSTQTLKEYHEYALEQKEEGNTDPIKKFYNNQIIDSSDLDIYDSALGLISANLAGYTKIGSNITHSVSYKLNPSDKDYISKTYTFDNIKNLLQIIAENFNLTSWHNLLWIKSEQSVPPTEFSDVGIFKDGDNAFVMVFTNSLSLFDIKYALTSNWLVYKDLYEANKQQQGALTLTSYGTSVDKYMGYGPYKLASYQKDKELVFERNDNWYGYKSDKTNYHEGQFQTTRIVTQIIKEQGTALLEFEKGNLDQIKLVSNDLEKYKFSDYMLRRTGGNTWQIAFNSDPTALKAIEDAKGDGNRRILSVTEFRKALSECINRQTIGTELTAGGYAAFSYINENYYYDMQNNSNSVYRTSDEGMKAIVELYGMKYGDGEKYATLKDAYNAVTGYDIEQARKDFEAAATKAIDQGLYTEGDNIRVCIYTNDLNATRTAIGQHMQTQVNAATKDTKLEGKVTIEWKQQQSGRNDDLNQGKIEASFYSSVSDYGDPYDLLGAYTNAGTHQLLEYGFNPAAETFAITYDFDGDGVIVDNRDGSLKDGAGKLIPNETEVSKTYLAWQKSVKAGGEYSSNVNTRLHILAQLENKLLSGFRTIPLYIGPDVLLRSKKVNYATDKANIFAAYGGVRLMTYNYDDAEWAKFCKKSKNLNYVG